MVRVIGYLSVESKPCGGMANLDEKQGEGEDEIGRVQGV